jgi:WD40 repeat protein
LAKLRVGATGVAKVCPERIYSTVVHPTADSLVVTCGDKWGNLGVWRVGHEGEEAVALYRPHTSVINMLQYHPHDHAKLYSLSYDGTIRCMDIVKGRFDFVAAIPAGGDVALQVRAHRSFPLTLRPHGVEAPHRALFSSLVFLRSFAFF